MVRKSMQMWCACGSGEEGEEREGEMRVLGWKLGWELFDLCVEILLEEHERATVGDS